MNKEREIKEIYVVPEIEIIEFSLKDSIATSGDFGSGLSCGEEIH
jgi:hypothetical protein